MEKELSEKNLSNRNQYEGTIACIKAMFILTCIGERDYYDKI